jgi:excisionase family DNA binding protein
MGIFPKRSKRRKEYTMNTDRASRISQKEAYQIMLRDYPDVMGIQQVCRILNVSTKTGYRLIKDGQLCCMKVGRTYRIPKVHLLTYLCIGGRSQQQAV